MVLYAKTLGATATVLGILVGMMPLLVIFQIPAAQYVSRVGFKQFVFAGWGTRVFFIFLMALAPLTHGFLNSTTRLALMLLLLFGFNLSRGISSAGWLPWIQLLVPAAVRGKYLAREAARVNLASCVSFMLAAACLGEEPRPWQFSVLFCFSALMGVASLFFLKRIPDVTAPEPPAAAGGRVPWLEMVRFAPFRKLLRTIVAWSMAYGGMTAFTVAFLKAEVGMAEGKVLWVTSVMFLGGWCSLWFLGSRLDHLGSKPVLMFSFVTWSLIVAGWSLVAGKLWAPWLALVLALQFLMGLFAALVHWAASDSVVGSGMEPVQHLLRSRGADFPRGADSGAATGGTRGGQHGGVAEGSFDPIAPAHLGAPLAARVAHRFAENGSGILRRPRGRVRTRTHERSRSRNRSAHR